MINERYFRHLSGNKEDIEHRVNGKVDWKRAIPVTSPKEASVSFRNTRKVVNLFNKNNRTRITGYFASTGTTWYFATSAYSNKIPCKPNTTYTARYNGNSTQAVLGFGSCSTDEEPSADNPTITVTRGVRQNSPTINTPITITTGPNDKWLIVAYNVAEPQHTDMAENLQIEEGSTATPYYPYFSPLKVLPSLKAFGADPVKVKAPKLWGRYVPCEYLEGSGEPYIDTDIIANNNTEVELDYAIYSSGSVYIFGTRVSGTQYFTISGSQTGGTNTNFVNGNSANINVGNRVSSVWNRLYQKVSTNNGTVNWNATNKNTGVSNSGSYSATIPTLKTTLRLFSNSTEYEHNGRIYSCKLKQNNILVRDFVPVKDVVDNVYGMFDRVTETFYGNAGTGAFTGGELIQPISYAENDGTVYCDTDIIPKTFDYTITYEGAIKTLSSGPNCVWGYMGNSGNNPRWLCASYNNNAYLLNANTTESITGADTNNHTFIAQVYDNNGTPYWRSEIDGVQKQNKSLSSIETWQSNTLSIYLFARHNADGAGNFAPATLKRWICEKNGVVIKHYIPVRIGTKVELLDLVSWSFAARTGTLTAGADIPYSILCPDIIKIAKGELKYGVGKNLFDGGERGTYVSTSGVKVDNDGKYRSKNKIPVVAGRTYSNNIINKPSWATFTQLNIFGYDAQGGFLWAGTSSVNAWSIGGTYTMPENTAFITVSTFGTVVDSDERVAELNGKFMIVEGSTVPTAYEPHHFGFHTDGQHKVTISGKNLMVPTLHMADGLTEELTSDGRIHIYGTCTRTTGGYGIGSYNLPPGTYTLSCSISGNYGNITSITFNAITSFPLGQTRTVSKSAVTSSSAGIAIENGTQYDFYITPQIEESSIATPYEPHIPPITKTIDELLFHSTDYKDIQSGDEVHNWGVKVLDGVTAGLKFISVRPISTFYYSNVDQAGMAPSMSVICTHFENRNVVANGVCYAGNNVITFHHSFAELADANAWLASEYAKGTPVIVLYPLATPTTTPHTTTPIALNTKATRVVTSEAELTAANQVTYLGKGA